MPLRDAYRGVYSGLSGRDDPMFVGSRTSISIRIEVQFQFRMTGELSSQCSLIVPRPPTVGPAGSYSRPSSEPGSTIVADENEGLEAQTGPDYENKVGYRSREKSGSLLEGEHTVLVVHWDFIIDRSLFLGHGTQPWKLPVDLTLPRLSDHQ